MLMASNPSASVEEANVQSNEKNTQGDTPELPKEWNIDDPFQYAPPKPNEDPWTLLLEPLLRNDKMRCDAWIDEVQNLLIFAGLFSGVVTAFIVESYKNLQPDPNDSMINLLAHIATRLDDQSNSTTNPFPLQVPEQFSPNASTIRVNVFWFISLVLSLTTVLIGIISLQWLREHQSYPDLTPREAYAVFHMRTDAMRKWQVDRIFTAMPLLLQCALILFLGGIIDFLHAFGERAVVIPVAMVIGLTLVFLVATTVLPTVQNFSLYVYPSSSKKSRPAEWKAPPSQCPFKSPQSHAVRRLCKPLYGLFHYLTRRLRSYAFQRFWFHVIHPFTEPYNFTFRPIENFPVYIYYTSFGSNWVDFDKSWLTIRDAYMRRAFGRSAWYEYVGDGNDDVQPIYDIVMALNSQKYQKVTSAAAYHSLSALSEAALLAVSKHDLYFSTPSHRLRQNNYLFDLLSFSGESSLSEFLNLDAPFEEAEKGNYEPLKALTFILHQQNLLSFTDGGNGLSAHRKELLVRFFRHYYQGRHEMRLLNIKLKLPECLSLSTFDESYYPRSRDPDLRDPDLFEAFAWQMASLTSIIFQQFEGEFHPHSLVYNSFAQDVGLPFYMEVAGHIALKALSPPVAGSTHRSPTPLILAAKEKFHAVLTYIDQRLKAEISSWSDYEGIEQPRPSLFFYLATCYAHSFQALTTQEDSFATALRDTLLKYKKHTIDAGNVDSVLERRLCTDYRNRSYKYASYHSPFSTEWWNTFETPEPDPPEFDYGTYLDQDVEGSSRAPSVLYYPFENT